MSTPEIDSLTTDVLHAAVHDLKGPAHRLRLLCQLLCRVEAIDEDTRKLLGYVEDSAVAVGAVAEGLHNYVELCARSRRLENMGLDLALSAAKTNLRAEIEAAGAEIAASGLPRVQADPFLMTWLFQELLTNALRFGRRPPRVRVSSGAAASGGWFVSVVNDGPGIEASQAERVFLPFKKLEAGRGAGMGLTICRKIAELHQGRMWVEPCETGADVRFSLGAAAGKQE